MTTPYKKALDSALRILSRRDHSIAELRRKLIQRKIDKPAIEQVLAECRRLNYLDDIRFAQGLIRHFKRKGWGPLRLQREFFNRGLKGTEISQLLDQAFNEGEEFQIAHQVAVKKQSSLTGFEPRKRRGKLFQFLVSRGFSKSSILKVLNQIDLSAGPKS